LVELHYWATFPSVYNLFSLLFFFHQQKKTSKKGDILRPASDSSVDVGFFLTEVKKDMKGIMKIGTQTEITTLSVFKK